MLSTCSIPAMHSQVNYSSSLDLLLLGSFELRAYRVEDEAKDMSEEQVALPVGNGPIKGKELKGRNHVLNNKRSAEHGNNAPGTPLAASRFESRS
mmetsp:Transcript_12492/g.27010  ORF Transcript_12492/g.27010 Transcript_12492/m.27010 type:complete len:95 (+) Transcript_12492:946-1230(+)